jgi:hypothetical protein
MQDEFLRLQFMLEKCIAFIPHDLHEAIRIADRSANMRDGAVIQIGAPENLVAPSERACPRVRRRYSARHDLSAPTPMHSFSGGVDHTVQAPTDIELGGQAPLLSGSIEDAVVLDARSRATGAMAVHCGRCRDGAARGLTVRRGPSNPAPASNDPQGCQVRCLVTAGMSW